ncbi:MAG: imidazole glycerol phosphate synthase subunit HisH [Aggregatilineales bacterium]
MLSVVHSDVANLRSVMNTLRRLKIDAELVSTPNEVERAERIILPGVGAFSAGMAGLHARSLVEPLREQAARGTLILGICLGMQLLFDRSEELGEFEGLGLLPGRIVRFPTDGPKVPHIGWNQLQHTGKSTLLAGVPDGGYAYFVHSYHAVTPPELVLACTDYGLPFPAVVGQDNVFGAQFHPEKSQGVGLRLLANFATMSV